MRRKIVKFGVPIIFIVSVIIAIVVYISIHNNKKAVIKLDYSDLQGLDYRDRKSTSTALVSAVKIICTIQRPFLCCSRLSAPATMRFISSMQKPLMMQLSRTLCVA